MESVRERKNSQVVCREKQKIEDRRRRYMKKHKIIKRVVLIIVIVIFVAFAGMAGVVYRVIYPSVMVSGSGEKRVLCIGDSITYGQGVIGSRKENSYPAFLAEKLGSEYQVKNYGLCNRTLVSDGQMPYGAEDFAEESLNEDADIVIIMLGTNDSKKANWNAARYEEEYIQFVQKYQSMESAPQVYIMTPPCIYVTGEGNCDNEVVRDEIVPILGRVADVTGAQLIDLYTLTEGHPEWFADGLHPNAEGNKAISQEIYGQMTQE